MSNSNHDESDSIHDEESISIHDEKEEVSGEEVNDSFHDSKDDEESSTTQESSGDEGVEDDERGTQSNDEDDDEVNENVEEKEAKQTINMMVELFINREFERFVLSAYTFRGAPKTWINNTLSLLLHVISMTDTHKESFKYAKVFVDTLHPTRVHLTNRRSLYLAVRNLPSLEYTFDSEVQEECSLIVNNELLLKLLNGELCIDFFDIPAKLQQYATEINELFI